MKSRIQDNVLSAVTAQGSMDYLIKDETIKGSQYIEFLEQLIVDRDRPLILLVDHATFHKSKEVRRFTPYTNQHVVAIRRRCRWSRKYEQVHHEGQRSADPRGLLDRGWVILVG